MIAHLYRRLALFSSLVLIAPLIAQGKPISDEFNSCGEVAAHWTVLDPLGDSPIRLQSGGTQDAHLEISVAGGVAHDAAGLNLPPRIVQPTADEDFSLELKFETRPASRYQFQGLLVQQDPGNWLRFDFYSKGSGVRLYAAETIAGVTSLRYNSAITPTVGTPLYMRLIRTGDLYTQRWSNDGVTWSNGASFTSALIVTATGVMAGNAGSSPPAFLVRCDYSLELSSPPAQADGELPDLYPLALSVSGAGAVLRDQEQALYSCVDVVNLTPVPDSGWRFDHWELDLSGNSNPGTITIENGKDVGAVFVIEHGPPQISNVQVDAGAAGASISWQTDEPATSFVDWGLSSGYGQTDGSTTLVTSHQVVLSGLSPATLYHFRVRSRDAANNESATGDALFATSFDVPLQSDDFNTCDGLASLWQSKNPLGDASFSVLGAGSGNAQLRIDIPAGISHDPYNLNRAPRVMQRVPDEDFALVAKFDSFPSQKFQSQGIMVEQDADDWLRFDFYSDGTGLRLFAASTTNGLSAPQWNRALTVTGGPLYLRLTRSGDRWQQAWSSDGVSWNAGADFVRSLALNEVGVFAANSGSAPPAFVALCDYAFNTNAPIVPEDGNLDLGPFDLTATALGNGQIDLAPGSGPYDCGTLVTAQALAAPGWAFDHWEGAADGSGNPAQIRLDRDRSLLAVFVQDVGPPLIGNVAVQVYPRSARITWTTSEPATSAVDYGLSPAYGSNESSSLLVTEHSLLLAGLSPETLYHFQVTSVDANGNAAQTADDVFLTAPAGAFLSDDFNRCAGLDPIWTALDPLGGATIASVGGGTSDVRLSISVPAGVAHDLDGVVLAPRVMQSAQDQDFVLVAKFDSLPTLAYQIQGVLIEQDADDWLRFDFYSTGAKFKVHAASTVAGVTTTLIDKKIASASPIFLRVARAGNSYQLSYSTDGLLFNSAGAVSRSLGVSQVGLFAGNAGATPPAFTALVDYIFEQASPINPEDGGGASGGPYGLTTDAQGSGSLARIPDLASYDCGTQVTLTATPAPGWVFSHWQGDLAGNNNPGVLTIQGESQVSAIFVVDGPPLMSNVQIIPAATTATVLWTTDVPATSLVEYGLDTSYGATVQDNALVQQHSLLVSGLLPETVYHLRLSSQDAEGQSTQSGDYPFSTLTLGNLVSDDFNGCGGLDPAWATIDPLGGASFDLVGAGTEDAQLRISVPAGTSHDPYDINQAPRIMQAVSDVDFEVEIKFESLPTLAYQIQGLILEQDAANWLRFDLYSNGTALYGFAARTVASDSTTLWNVNLGSGFAAPLYLRVARSGNSFTQRYSSDGLNWVQIGSTNHVMGVTAAGAFAANAGSNAPAYTGVFDYVFDTANPLVPEDGPSTDGPFTLNTSALGQGSVLRNPDQTTYGCGTEVVLTAVPQSGWRFDHWENDTGGFQNPTTIQMVADKDARAVFVFDQDPPIITNIVVNPGSTTANVSWTTNEPATSLIEYGLDANYGSSVSSGTYVTSHALALSGLTPNTQYHYRLTATDGVGLSTSTADATFTTLSPSGFMSDDFNRHNLDRGLWTYIDPFNDGTLQMAGAGTSNAQLLLGVPAGVGHVPYGTNDSVRVMQTVNGSELDLGAKFESDLSSRFQIQGLIVEQDALNWLRFDVYHDGSALRAFCASHSNGVPTNRGNVVVANGPWIGQGPIFLRVTRSGDSWLYRYSFDEVLWYTAAGPFTYVANISAAGPFVGNAVSGGNAAPAHTARIDWFQNLAEPLLQEDVGLPADNEAPYLYRSRAANITGSSARIEWFNDEVVSGWVEYGLTNSYELGSSPIVGPAYAPLYLIEGLDALTTYHYRVISQDANLATTTSADQTFTTTTGGGGGTLPYFSIWYGNPDVGGAVRQRFGQLGLPQTWVNVLGNVIDPDGSITNLTYSLNGGPQNSLNWGPDSRRLLMPGDFCTEIAYSELLSGDNSVVLTATDNQGNQSQATVIVEYTPGVVWPDAYVVDWAGSTDVQDHVQIVDGKWAIENGMLHPLELGYDRLFAFGDISHTSYEVSMTLTVNALDSTGYGFPSNGPAVGLGMRWTGHTGTTQPRWGFWPTGCFAWYRWGPTPSRFELRTNQYQDSEFDELPLDLGVPWVFKARCLSQGNGTTAYSFKYWKAAEAEPANWLLNVTGTAGDPQAGSILVLAHHADVDFAEISVVPLQN